MQKTLVSFSLTLIFKVKILDIPKLFGNAKGYLISQNFLRNVERRKKEKIQVPQRNEMLSLYCTALGFINKNK